MNSMVNSAAEESDAQSRAAILDAQQAKWAEVLARNVIVARARCKFSQLALADKTGLSRATISNIERPGNGSPTFDNIVLIAHALGVTPPELMQDTQGDISDDELLELAKTARHGAVDAHALLAAVDEAAGRPIERYSHAGRPARDPLQR